MAELSLGESKWRMLRLALKKPRRFRFEDVRAMIRKDRENLDWLVARGFVADLSGGSYAITGRGKAAADLGLYEFTTADAEVRVPKQPRRGPERPRRQA
jgi:hypothetical protein